MRLLLYILLLGLTIGCKEKSILPATHQAAFHLSQIKTDSLFNSQQAIHLLSIDDRLVGQVLDLAYRPSELVKTSTMAEREHAIAAINGGFFDMDKGGSVSYLEEDNEVISNTRSAGAKWAVADSLINGIILFTKNRQLVIDNFKSDDYYTQSKKEKFAIATGPLLLKGSVPQKLANTNFTHRRHPRSCLCKTEDAIIFIVIDGRSETAAGMNLPEAQQYLQSLGCIDAINLDGGGSSTLWVKGKGVVNTPSDKNGERAVANALLVLDKRRKGKG